MRKLCEEYLGVKMRFNRKNFEISRENDTATVVDANSKSVVLDMTCPHIGQRHGSGSFSDPDVIRFSHRLFIRRIMERLITIVEEERADID